MAKFKIRIREDGTRYEGLIYSLFYAGYFFWLYSKKEVSKIRPEFIQYLGTCFKLSGSYRTDFGKGGRKECKTCSVFWGIVKHD